MVVTARQVVPAAPADGSSEPWRDLITDIHALRLTVYAIADRLRSWRSTA